MLMPLPVMDPNVTEFGIVQQKTGRTITSTISFFFTLPPFAADYTCRASNLLGTAEEIATLTVHGEYSFSCRATGILLTDLLFLQ